MFRAAVWHAIAKWAPLGVTGSAGSEGRDGAAGLARGEDG